MLDRLSRPEPLVADPERRPLGPDPGPGPPAGYKTCLLELPPFVDLLPPLLVGGEVAELSAEATLGDVAPLSLEL